MELVGIIIANYSITDTLSRRLRTLWLCLARALKWLLLILLVGDACPLVHLYAVKGPVSCCLPLSTLLIRTSLVGLLKCIYRTILA